MAAKVLVIGFDAMEATLVEQWAADGKLPAFDELTRKGILFRPNNRVEYLPATIWPEIMTGRLGGTIGWYWNRHQVFAGEAQLRGAREGDTDLTAVWSIASDAGKVVAALDVPQQAPARDLNGIQLWEWGTHETAFGYGTAPPEFGDEVGNRFGTYPGPQGDACEFHPTLDDYRRLREGLLQAVDTKARMYRELLDERDWDLFFAVFSESHCVSHQFWRFFDQSSEWFERAEDELASTIPDVYARLDSALAHVLGGVSDDTTVFAVISHGMGPSVGGPQLLPEVLVRLGYGSGQGAVSDVRSKLPAPVKRAIKAVIRGRLRRRLQAAAGSLPQPLESSATRAAAVSNGRTGAIRLNVRGRDPFGTIDRGTEYDGVCTEIADAIADLRHADSGEPAVERVVRADSLFGEDVHPNIPDLLVLFDQSRPIRAIRSGRVGTVSTPIEEHTLDRSGDHTPHSRIWVRGPGIPGGRATDAGDVLDLAPTILNLLGVEVPTRLHGRPLPLAAPAVA